MFNSEFQKVFGLGSVENLGDIGKIIAIGMLLGRSLESSSNARDPESFKNCSIRCMLDKIGTKFPLSEEKLTEEQVEFLTGFFDQTNGAFLKW